MTLQRTLRRAYLHMVYSLCRITGTGAFGPEGAEYVHGPLSADGNRLKAALLKHHVKQFHGASCSVASVVSSINAIKELQSGETAPVSQMDILNRVDTADWKARMLDKDYKGRRGLPLSVLGKVVESSLKAYGIDYRAIETVSATRDPGRSKGIRRTLRERLSGFEQRGDCLLIAHFDQGVFLPALNIPHISPVGGYDQETGKVLILDVDPEEEKHYRIGFDTFYRGLTSNCHRLFDVGGFGRGGYVFVKLS